MKIAQFLVISQITHQDTVRRITELRRKLVESHPGAIKVPRLETPYVTIVPPFFASIDEGKYFQMGVGIMEEIHRHNEKGMRARVGYPGFFENEDEDALFYGINYPESFRILIDALREEVGKISTWVHPPKGDTVFPHTTVCTGKNLKQLLGGGSWMDRDVVHYPIDEPIQPPKLCIRRDGESWKFWDY